MNRICYILRAYPGSGKSFKANELKSENENTEIVSADYFWNDSNGNYNFDISRLPEAHEQCFQNFKNYVSSGVNVIVDNTNLRFKDIAKYIDALIHNNKLNSHIYSVKFLEVEYNNLETAIKLRTNRVDGKNIPENRMREMFKAYKQDVRGMILSEYSGKISLNELDELATELPWKNSDEKLKDCILCDLDGTLAIFEYMNGIKIRSPYDASKAEQDIICKPVAEALRAFYNIGYEIIFVSGREDKFRNQTTNFLKLVCEKYKISYDKLLMRKSGDNRKDTIIKKEIYDSEILGKYNVLAVFDDRNSVIKMWKENGLYVFDCNYRGSDF